MLRSFAGLDDISWASFKVWSSEDSRIPPQPNPTGTSEKCTFLDALSFTKLIRISAASSTFFFYSSHLIDGAQKDWHRLFLLSLTRKIESGLKIKIFIYADHPTSTGTRSHAAAVLWPRCCYAVNALHALGERVVIVLFWERNTSIILLHIIAQLGGNLVWMKDFYFFSSGVTW